MAGLRYTGSFAWIALAMAAAFAADAFAERQPYERYRSIVDRQMFGPLPPNFDPTKSPAEVSKSGGAAEKELTKEQEKVKSSVRFSVINVTPDGETAIGFTDNSDPKAPKHYYLKVGESRGGWEVKEADAKEATMTIAKDGVEVSLSLGGDSSKDGKAQPAAATQTQGRSPILGTLGSRRRARMEREEADRREAANREAEAKAREEERARREEEDKARRDAEREEQRSQLQQIQEELRKAREERQAQEEKKKAADDGSPET